jgi:Glyoxalase-like domain
MLKLGTIVLGADDVGRAVAFWSSVLDYEVVSSPDPDDDFTILVPPDRSGTRIAVHRSVTPCQERPRVHVDLVVGSPDEQSSEVDRLVALGATRVPCGLASTVRSSRTTKYVRLVSTARTSVAFITGHGAMRMPGSSTRSAPGAASPCAGSPEPAEVRAHSAATTEP